MVEKQHRWSLSWDSTGMLSGAFQAFHFNRSLLHEHSFLSSYHLIDVSDHGSEHIIVISGYEFCFKWSLSSRSNLPHFMAILGPILCIFSHEEYWKDSRRWFHQSLMHEHHKKPHYRAKIPSPESFPFFWAPTRALTCPSGWGHCSFFTQEPFTTSTENMVLW